MKRRSKRHSKRRSKRLSKRITKKWKSEQKKCGKRLPRWAKTCRTWKKTRHY